MSHTVPKSEEGKIIFNCSHADLSAVNFEKLVEKNHKEFIPHQAAISWRASGNRQISLNASAERAFANFRDKKHRILQLQIFATKTSFFTHFCNKNVFLQFLATTNCSFLQLHENKHFHGATVISDYLGVH